MKKIIYLFCLICTITLAKGQFYRPDRGFLPGINAGYFYPTGDMGKILKNGIGGNVSAKYLINKMIGIGFEAGYYGFKTKVNLNKDDVSQKYKYHLIPVLLEATFYVPTWNRTTLPYLGIQFGGYFSQLDVGRQYTGYSASLSFSKHLFLFSPGVGLHGGLLFQLSDKVWMDLKVRADYVPRIDDAYEYNEYTQGNIGFNKMLNIGGNIGLLYRF